jgi:predicted phage terminase large subunit-like protein
MTYEIAVDKKYLSYYNFFLEAFKVLEPQTPFVSNWHIKFVCNVLQAETYRILANKPSKGDLIINVPFRTGKSYITTIVYPVWSWIINPHMGFLTVSYSSALSTEHARKSRQLIQSDWFQENFGHIFEMTGDQNVKSNYENDKGGKRFATSTTATATGTGGDVIILDDPLNPKEASSEVERSRANTAYSETFYSRTKNPHTAIRIIVMQRLHEDDLSGYLLKKEGYRHICIPGELTNEVKPTKLRDKYKDGLFWPTRFTQNLLDKFKVELGSVGYAGQILQTPTPPSGNIFKKEWFGIVHELPQNATWHVKVDPAYTSKSENDPTAVMCYAWHDNFLYIRNVETVRLEFPQLVTFLKSYAHNHGLSRQSKIYIEPKASGKSIVQQLRSETGLNVLEDKPPERDKVSRANAVSAKVEAGRVKLLAGGWNDRFLGEVIQFPYAKHDDQVDVMVMALNDEQKTTFFAL